MTSHIDNTNTHQNSEFSHLNNHGAAQMVDISAKASSCREAIASAKVQTTPEVIGLLQAALLKKGDALACARIAGIMAAKKTSDLIPLCHPLALTQVDIQFSMEQATGRLNITASCKVQGNTGVEMEALTAAAVSALTIHDMCKAVDPALVISDIQLEQKTGGKSGDWQRSQFLAARQTPSEQLP